MNAYERRQELRIAKEKLRKQQVRVDRMITVDRTFSAYEEVHKKHYGAKRLIIDGTQTGGHYYVVDRGSVRRMTLKAIQRETEILWAKVHEREIGNG